MKTTELFIEQVIIGCLVLTMCLLPIYPEIYRQYDQYYHPNDLFISAAAVGVAYLLGIISDRYADSCTKRYESHLRARYAIELGKTPSKPVIDPFPEDRYRVQQLKMGQGVNDWFSYLRSTLRLSRALSVFMPGVTLAAVLAIARSAHNELGDAEIVGYGIMAASYFGLPVILGAFECCRLLEVPKTNKPRLKIYAKRRGLDQQKGKRTWKQRRAQLLDVLLSPEMLAAFLLLGTAVAEAIALKGSDKQAVAIVAAVGGSGIAALSVLTWVKIQQTFMRYLYLLDRYGAIEPAGRVSG